MPSSDSVWRRGPPAPTGEPQTPPRPPPWRRNNTSAAPRGRDPKASPFAWDRSVVAHSGTTTRDVSASSSEASSSTDSLASTFSAISLSSSPSSSPERTVTPPAAPGILPGFIYQARIKSARLASSLLLKQQPHVNDEVERHPCMVWDVYQREDGVKVARCLQMTSFGKRGVEGKYDKPHVWAFHCQYLPVGHGGTKSRTNQPILELQDGEKMETQSYVHLDHFFEIEARYLVAWGRGRYPVPMGLTSGALDVLRAKLVQFANEGIFRKRNNSGPLRSPLDIPGLKPQFSQEVQAAAARGRATEEIRSQALAVRHERIWTGLEKKGDSPPAL